MAALPWICLNMFLPAKNFSASAALVWMLCCVIRSVIRVVLTIRTTLPRKGLNMRLLFRMKFSSALNFVRPKISTNNSMIVPHHLGRKDLLHQCRDNFVRALKKLKFKLYCLATASLSRSFCFVMLPTSFLLINVCVEDVCLTQKTKRFFHV